MSLWQAIIVSWYAAGAVALVILGAASASAFVNRRRDKR